MNGFRKMMMNDGGNLSWCVPYVSEDGKNAIVMHEGEIDGMMIDGVDMDLNFDIAKFARAVNPDYDDYKDAGWDDLYIALNGKICEESCANCPWFDSCEAMANPVDWDSTPAADEYPDD